MSESDFSEGHYDLEIGLTYERNDGVIFKVRDSFPHTIYVDWDSLLHECENLKTGEIFDIHPPMEFVDDPIYSYREVK